MTHKLSIWQTFLFLAVTRTVQKSQSKLLTSSRLYSTQFSRKMLCNLSGNDRFIKCLVFTTNCNWLENQYEMRILYYSISYFKGWCHRSTGYKMSKPSPFLTATMPFTYKMMSTSNIQRTWGIGLSGRKNDILKVQIHHNKQAKMEHTAFWKYFNVLVMKWM